MEMEMGLYCCYCYCYCWCCGELNVLGGWSNSSLGLEECLGLGLRVWVHT